METQSIENYKKEIEGYMEKPFPHNVIEIFKDHLKVKALLSKTGLSILDMGCNVPEFMFFLYHERTCFEYFVGVELQSEKKVIADMRQHYKSIPIDKEITSVYDFYVDGQLRQPEDFNPPIKETLSKEDFDKYFELNYNLHSGDFLYNGDDTRKFDYLILSNIIHLDGSIGDDYDRYISMLFDKLNSGGLIFVKVNHENNPNSISLNHRKFNEESFKALFAGKFEELFYKNVEENGIIQSMVYFGVKL